MRYPLIFPHGEQAWHPLIPLADMNLADNVNLHARHHANNAESDEDEQVQRHGLGGSARVIQSQYYAFQLQNCHDVFSSLFHAGRLCQEFCVDAWVCVEANRLNFARTHQAELCPECYNGIQDAIGAGVEEDAHRLGRQIILHLSPALPDI